MAAPVADATGLVGTTPTATVTTTLAGGLLNAPHVDARRSSLNTNDLRGKLLRIRVAADGSYTTPAGNLFAPGTAKTRPEIYAMGFRNPFRVQVDDDGTAYVTDYSPDSSTPQQYRGPAGTGRVQVVTKPSNYGWPLCYSPDLPYYRWDFVTSTPLDSPPQTHDCDDPTRGPLNSSRWNLQGGPTVEAGLAYSPPISKPDIWYSFQDNNPTTLLGTPCFAYYGPDAASNPRCPQLAPELLTGGVGPHGAAPYDYDATSASTTKFPPYYDGAFIMGEFTRDYLREVRLDSQGRVFKINNTLSCGAALVADRVPVRVRQPHGHAVRGRRQPVPADLRRRLLRRQPRRRHVPAGLRQGHARAAGGPHRLPDERAGTPHRAVLQRGLARRGPGRLDQLPVGLRRQRHGRLGGRGAQLRLHDAGAVRRPADGHRLQRQDRLRQHGDHGRQHRADRHGHHAGRRGARSPSATRSPSPPRSPTPRTGRSTARRSP